MIVLEANYCADPVCGTHISLIHSTDDAHSQVIAAEYDRLLRGVRGASTGEVCSNIQGRRSVVK